MFSGSVHTGFLTVLAEIWTRPRTLSFSWRGDDAAVHLKTADKQPQWIVRFSPACTRDGADDNGVVLGRRERRNP
jgi:hypothetical protein